MEEGRPAREGVGWPGPEHFGEGPLASLHRAVEMKSHTCGRGRVAERADPHDELLLSWSQVESLTGDDRTRFLNFAYQVGSDLFSGPPDDVSLMRDYAHFQNHSDIQPGEELTYDYCTSDTVLAMRLSKCYCGSALCRGGLTGKEWQNPELRERYGDHWVPYILDLINEHTTSSNASV